MQTASRVIVEVQSKVIGSWRRSKRRQGKACLLTSIPILREDPEEWVVFV